MRKNKLAILYIIGVLIMPNAVERVRAEEYSKNQILSFTDKNGNKIYNEGGVYLGENLDDECVRIRYWDGDYSINTDYVLSDYYYRNLFALNSTTHSLMKYSPCIVSAVMGALKGIEVNKLFEDETLPLLGPNIGRYILGNDNNYRNNYEAFWPDDSNIYFSRTNYRGDSNYPLAVNRDAFYKISYVLNESIKIGYYMDHVYQNRGAKYIVDAISEYLKNEKTSENRRYIIANEDTTYHMVDNEGYINSANNIFSNIKKGYPVMIGDNDFVWAGSDDDAGGHMMLAVGVGTANFYDYTSNRWVKVKEIIYDQGGGHYSAMPIVDVYDYFTLEIKLQKKENYGLFNWFTRWVDIR